MEVQLVQRSSGQIQFRIAFMPDSRSFRASVDGLVVVVVGWNGLPLLLLPFLALRWRGVDEKEKE